jgi:hypothetical protein
MQPRSHQPKPKRLEAEYDEARLRVLIDNLGRA